MLVSREISLSDFKFWSGAEDRANMLTSEELDALEPHVLEMLGDEEPITETALNDLFWFDFEAVIECIGLRLNSRGDIIRSEEDEDEEEAEETED